MHLKIHCSRHGFGDSCDRLQYDRLKNIAIIETIPIAIKMYVNTFALEGSTKVVLDGTALI